jgi:hypothetical protein
MPRRTSIGLSTDTHTRSLGILGSDEIPIIVDEDDGTRWIRILASSKGHQVWWDGDDTYNGNTDWIPAGPGGTAVETAFLVKLNSDLTWDEDGVLDQVGLGVRTPNSPAPGTPYAPSGPVPTGGIGNGWETPILSSAFGISVNAGDKLAIVAYSLHNLDAASDPPGEVFWVSDPYFEIQFAVYQNDGTTLIHDFGTVQVDLSGYDPVYPGDYPRPGFYYPVSDNFYQSSYITIT